MGCTFDGMIGDRDAIDFDFDGAERSLSEGCPMMNGADDGIDLGATSVDIRDNVFFNIQDKALFLEGNGTLGPPTVTGNIIFGCGTAMALKNGVTIDEGPWPGEGNIDLDPRFTSVEGQDFSLQPGSPCIGTGRPVPDTGADTDMSAVPFTGDRFVFVRGDVDASGTLELTDVILAFDFLFRSGPAPVCFDRIDANDDGAVNIAAAVRSLIYQFAGGMILLAPFPETGQDPTSDELRCIARL